jgi:hypothetical protein
VRLFLGTSTERGAAVIEIFCSFISFQQQAIFAPTDNTHNRALFSRQNLQTAVTNPLTVDANSHKYAVMQQWRQ